jgi:hypothetical protein
MNEISSFIIKHFDFYFIEYNFLKYPNDIYLKSKETFSKLSKENDCIDIALRWKWGHAVDKINIPKSHSKLIEEVKTEWINFISSGNFNTPLDTFTWWKKN